MNQSNSKKQNRYLDFLINPSFQRVGRLFVLSIQNYFDRNSCTGYYLPLVEQKNYYVVME